MNDDPNRNALGEFHYLGFGTQLGEQWGAGVNQYDNHFSAGLKVRNQRMLAGLDEFTGLPRTPGGAGYSSGYSSAGSGQMAAVLWGAFKWTVLWPGIFLAAVIVVAVIVAVAERVWSDSGPENGMAAMALSSVAPGAGLSPPSTYLSPKQIASAPSLDALLRGSGVGKPTQNQLAAAYLCAARPACARDAEKRSGVFVLARAELFLLGEARRGSQAAARDACLLPLISGSRMQPIFMARVACAIAARDARSTAAKELSRAFEVSWSAKGARVVEWIGDAACLDRPEPFCRLSDAPRKLVGALSWNYDQARLAY